MSDSLDRLSKIVSENLRSIVGLAVGTLAVTVLHGVLPEAETAHLDKQNLLCGEYILRHEHLTDTRAGLVRVPERLTEWEYLNGCGNLPAPLAGSH